MHAYNLQCLFFLFLFTFYDLGSATRVYKIKWFILLFQTFQLQAKPYLQAGAFEIVDESIQGTFDLESMKKAASIAVKSVERDASQRPPIAQVLAELKEAYSIQLRFLESCQKDN